MDISTEKDVKLPVATVFEEFCDPSRFAVVFKAITGVERVGEGPLAPGAEWRMTAKMMGRKVAGQTRLTERSDSEHVAFETEIEGFAARIEHSFASTADGTRVTSRLTLAPANWKAKLMAPLVASQEKNVRDRMELKLGQYAARMETAHA